MTLSAVMELHNSINFLALSVHSRETEFESAKPTETHRNTCQPHDHKISYINYLVNMLYT
jgi:hypothetical protein